jgi:hypothetical protein
MALSDITHKTLSFHIGAEPAQELTECFSSSATWGGISGTLSNQTDLQNALTNKVDKNAPVVGAAKTKVTYDAKGLVTAGADATTADIAPSTNRNYVSDAQLAVIGNTSGVNTGDQDLSGIITPGHSLYVDGARTDIYTPNGSVSRPFKTIQSAIDSVSGSGAAAPYTIHITAGSYTENVTVAKPYVSLQGEGEWATFINGNFVLAPDGSAWNASISDIGFPSGSFSVHGNNTMGVGIPRIYLRDLRIGVPCTLTEDSPTGSLIVYVFDCLFANTMSISNGTSAWLYDCHGTSAATTIDSASAVEYFGGSTQSAITVLGAATYISMSAVGTKAPETRFTLTATEATQQVTLDSVSLGNCTLVAGPAIVTLTGQADATHAGSVSTTAQTFGGAKAVAEVALTSAAGSIAVDLALANDFRHTTTENTTLAAPTHPVAAQAGSFVFTQGATPRTLAFDAFWKFPGGTVPTLTATAGAVDMLVYRVLPGATSAVLQAALKDIK